MRSSCLPAKPTTVWLPVRRVAILWISGTETGLLAGVFMDVGAAWSLGLARILTDTPCPFWRPAIQKMRLLALDTATEACSVALWLDGQLCERFELAGRTHTQRMLPMVHELMAGAGIACAQLDGLVCGVGPGSFAGVRIGVGFMKGLALALDRPVVGIGSLDMMAQAAMDEAGATQVLAVIDARMQEVYFGAYRRDAAGLAHPLERARVLAPDAVQLDHAGPWHAVGSGWGAHESALRARVAGELLSVDAAALPRAAMALRLALPVFAAGAAASADDLAPAYLRDKVALTLEEQRASKLQP